MKRNDSQKKKRKKKAVRHVGKKNERERKSPLEIKMIFKYSV